VSDKKKLLQGIYAQLMKAQYTYIIEHYWCPYCEEQSGLKSTGKNTIAVAACCDKSRDVIYDKECKLDFCPKLVIDYVEDLLNKFLHGIRSKEKFGKSMKTFFDDLNFSELGKGPVRRAITIIYLFNDLIDPFIGDDDRKNFVSVKKLVKKSFNEEDPSGLAEFLLSSIEERDKNIEEEPARA